MKKLAELLLECEEVSKIEIIQSLALTDHGSASLERSAVRSQVTRKALE